MAALGSFRKILVRDHSIWVKVHEREVPALACAADAEGYHYTILAHSQEENVAWVALWKGKGCTHSVGLYSRWWSRLDV